MSAGFEPRYHAPSAEHLTSDWACIRRSVVDDQAIRAALERHWSDINNQDVVHEIYHPDVVLEFPQGGERLVGVADVRAMRDAYPSRLALRTERIRGSGNLWVAENVITY